MLRGCRPARQSDPINGEVPGSGPDTQNRVALLTTRGQEAAPRVDETVLCKLYGLTRAEAALAANLLQGKSIEEAAAELVISHHTARTHTKRIFIVRVLPFFVARAMGGGGGGRLFFFFFFFFFFFYLLVRFRVVY